MLSSSFMDLCAVIQNIGNSELERLMNEVSIGKLRTFNAYDSFKVHAGMTKLNRERLRKSLPKFWQRLEEGDRALAGAITQAILFSNLPFVIEVLDFLEIPHDDNGFFDPKTWEKKTLCVGWQKRTYEKFSKKYPRSLILIYLNHLSSEVDPSAELFLE